MENNSDLPDGWAMPNDLAKKVSEVLNRKSITPEQELQDALDEMARDIALIEPDPEDWGGWVMYCIDQLEEEAKRRIRWGDFNLVLDTLGIARTYEGDILLKRFLEWANQDIRFGDFIGLAFVSCLMRWRAILP